jgi:hypothetical protein
LSPSLNESKGKGGTIDGVLYTPRKFRLAIQTIYLKKKKKKKREKRVIAEGVFPQKNQEKEKRLEKEKKD